MCTDRLPGKLPNMNQDRLEFMPTNSVAFALCEEYNSFNDNISLVKGHLENLEKFILFNTQIFPVEWKQIALTLQSQRVPDEWESAWCRPSIHTLKSWVKAQADRYAQLKELGDNEFKNTTCLNASVLKNPCGLFSALKIQRAAEMKWDLNECELCFEVREDDDVLATEYKSKGNF